MTKLTTERLEKLQDDLLQFQDHYSDPADKENYDIFVDALHMLDEFKAAKEKILAYEQAAKNPVAIIENSEYMTAEQLAGEEPHKKAVKELYEGALVVGSKLYAAPVLPKQPELVENLKKVMNNWLAMEPKLAFQPEFTDVMMLIDAEPAPSQPAIPEQWRSFITDSDIAALHRFAECCDDPESGGHDLEKEQVQRLEKIGALQRSGRISYITDFGDYLISLTVDERYGKEG